MGEGGQVGVCWFVGVCRGEVGEWLGLCWGEERVTWADGLRVAGCGVGTFFALTRAAGLSGDEGGWGRFVGGGGRFRLVHSWGLHAWDVHSVAGAAGHDSTLAADLRLFVQEARQRVQLPPYVMRAAQ